MNAATLPREPEMRFRPATVYLYRFGKKYVIDKETGCWNWTAAKYAAGYGAFAVNGRPNCAHRWSYAYYVGAIPDGYQIDHLCRNRACVNPAHFEAVTQRENLLRGDTIVGRQARQTHCKRGHEFTPENTRRTKRGERVCITCNRAWQRERRRRERNGN